MSSPDSGRFVLIFSDKTRHEFYFPKNNPMSREAARKKAERHRRACSSVLLEEVCLGYDQDCTFWGPV